MNWFEHVFSDLVAYREEMMLIWKVVMFGLPGYLLALLFGVRSVSRRAIAFLVSAIFILLGPDLPLGWIGGRIGGLQNEAVSTLLVLGLSLVALLRGVMRPALPVLAGAIMGMVIAGLSTAYHMVLINGVDQAVRKEQAIYLLEDFMGSAGEVCRTRETVCGRGYDASGNRLFDKDLKDWTGFAPERPFWFGSNGTVGANPTYIWAAWRHDGEIHWVVRSYQAQTNAVEAGFLVLLMMAVGFWVGFAVLVEGLHGRMMRRRRSLRT